MAFERVVGEIVITSSSGPALVVRRGLLCCNIFNEVEPPSKSWLCNHVRPGHLHSFATGFSSDIPSGPTLGMSSQKKDDQKSPTKGSPSTTKKPEKRGKNHSHKPSGSGKTAHDKPKQVDPTKVFAKLLNFINNQG